jgi:hypothetical protein
MAGCLKFSLDYTWQSYDKWQKLLTYGKTCKQLAAIAYKWQHLSTHGNTCLQMAAAMSYSLAHLAVPYGGRQDARLEPKYIQMAAAIAYNGKKFPPTTTVDCKRQKLRTHIATGAYTWQHLLTNGNICLQMAAVADRWQCNAVHLIG